jgi:hypothetical protein
MIRKYIDNHNTKYTYDEKYDYIYIINLKRYNDLKYAKIMLYLLLFLCRINKYTYKYR